jgi:hypothetical protein
VLILELCVVLGLTLLLKFKLGFLGCTRDRVQLYLGLGLGPVLVQRLMLGLIYNLGLEVGLC